MYRIAMILTVCMLAGAQPGNAQQSRYFVKAGKKSICYVGKKSEQSSIIAKALAGDIQFLSPYFPELEKTAVRFKISRRFDTLKTRPTWGTVWLPKRYRHYIIFVSDHCDSLISPISFANLSSTARLGVLSHELSHVSDFSKKSTFQMLRIALGHLSKFYMDSLEYHTDEICIKHGLGEYLEAWSRTIRTRMHTRYWRGSDYATVPDTHIERYMNPDTIKKAMEGLR